MILSSYNRQIVRHCLSASSRSSFLLSTKYTINNYARRSLSSEAAATPSVVKKSGGGLFQRITSFLVGAGLTALGTQYYIYEEIKQSNTDMILKQQEIEKRIKALETNKK